MKILRTPASVASVTAWDHRAVGKLSLHGCDILIVERELIDLGIGIPASCPVGDFRAVVTRADLGSIVASSVRAMGLNCAELETDIVRLGESFLSQFRLPEADLRVEVVDTATCPKFHCDNIHIRLVATYSGPMTQYRRTDRPDEVLSPPVGSLVFLKGYRHVAHDDRILHRSPPLVAGEKRLVVVLDY